MRTNETDEEIVTLPRKIILVSVWKFLRQITVEDENQLAEIPEVFPKDFNERILRQWQQTYPQKLLCLLQFFFRFPKYSRAKKS